ncbi:protease [Streptomyces marokkonensis]|uniref:Protease n=1 Tax=Streptomyces marokkonensis TaxID=324855 RepID=A0ABW6QIJ5_9ACTN
MTALIAALLLAPVASAREDVPARPGPNAQQKAAVAQLVKDYGVSAQEGERRIARQDEQAALATKLREKLGARFGGAWVDHERGGRLRVAVTEKSSASVVNTSAPEQAAVEAVLVERSMAELQKMSDMLGKRIAKANEGAQHGLQSAVVTEKNVLRLDLPRGKKLTDKQRRVVRWAEHKFGDALVVDSYRHASRPVYCGGQYSCDPPLRSGLAIYGGNTRCTSAFMAYDRYGYYMMTAGHCTEAASYWEVPTYSYGYQGVGSTADYHFGYYGDYAVVRISDTAFWQPRGWVYTTQPIRSWDYDYVGQYVCKQGSTTGYTCGQITDTNATVHYPGRTLTGMTWSTACVAPGDSGSGVYNGSTAHGILSGGPNSGCGMIHEPISRALSSLGVSLLAG